MPLNTTTGFPRASKLIEKKWEERRMRLHAQRVHEVQPLVNTAPPKVYPHMVLRLKKIQSEEVKQAEIDRDNQILLQRMTWILKRKGKIDNWNDYRQMSMNKMVREREQQEIAEKNLSIAKKLDSVKPYYNAQEWEEEYEKRAHIQGQWRNSTKDFDQSTPRSSMASRRANSYEDKKDRRGSQKAKSDTTGSTVTKLPKIHNNGTTKYPREYTKPRRRKRRLSSRLSESEDETASKNSSDSENTEVKSDSEGAEKDLASNKEKARKKYTDSDEDSSTSQQSKKSKEMEEQKRKQMEQKKKQKEEQKRKERKEEQKRKEREEQRKKNMKEEQKRKDTKGAEKSKRREEQKRKEERTRSEKEKDVIKINEEEAESDDQDDENNYEAVFDRQRIQSVKKDKRLRSCREDAPRAFSGMMTTENEQDTGKDDKKQNPKREGTSVRSEAEGSDDDSEVTSSDNDDLENRSEKTEAPEPEPADEDAIADQDAKLLFRAVKNLSKPEEVVIKTLIRRTPKQRMLTKEKFEETYEMNLGPELKKVLGSPYFTLIDCLLGLKNKRDTSDIHSALKARDIAKLVEIFTSRGPSALSARAATYKKANWDDDNLDLQYFLDYDVSLEQDIRDRIPDEDCQYLLLALLSDRPVTETVSEDLAARDAQDIWEAGEGRFSNENGKFFQLVKQRSLAQLRAALNAYTQMSGTMDLTELLEEDGCSKNFATAIEALDESSKLDSGQWAEQIHGQLKPNNADLISTMLDRNDQEMTSIRKSYRKKFSAELTDDIMVKCGKEAGPLIAHIAARGGVAPGPGARQPRPPPGEKPRRVNGMTVPSPPKKPPLRGFEPKTPEFGKDNPFQEPQKRPIGEQIRQNAKDKLEKKPPAKGNKTDRDGKKKSPAKVGGKGSKSYNAEEDVKKVKEAMKGWGTDEEPLIQILAGRTNDQRQQIRKKYQEKYKSDLIEDLKDELSGDLEEAIVALMMGPGEYDAYCLHDAVSGPGTSEAVLIGILTTRSAKELKAISAKYEEMYGEALGDAVADDTSGGFGELLGRLVRGERDQSSSVDQKLVEQDAQDLYQDGDEHLSPQNETFKDVMTKRNRSHSRAVFEEYKKLSGHSIEDAIKDSFAGDLEDGYVGLAQAIQNTSDFYAQRLYNAMSGMGTNDKTLIRILVSRSEVDLADIKTRYKALYKKDLDDAVDAECSGDYKKLLLALIKDKAAEKPKEKRQRSVDRRDGSRERRPSPAASKTSSRATQGKAKTGASPRTQRRADVSKQTTPRREKPPTGRKPVRAAGPPSKGESQPKTTKDGAKTKEKETKKERPKENVSSETELNGGRIEQATKEEEKEDKEDIVDENRKEAKDEGLDSDRDDEGEEEAPREGDEQEQENNLVPRPPTPTQGTVADDNEANAEDDAKLLEEALAGWNNDEDALIALLSERKSKQRLDLRLKYEESHSKGLLPVIRSELKGDFESVVIQMLTSTEEQLASSLRGSIDSMVEDNCILNALLALGTKEEIVAVNEKYSEVYKSAFVQDVKDNKVQPSYVSILEDIMCGSRDLSYNVDEEKAKQDASTMYNGGDHSLKLRDDIFKALLTTANRSQVKSTCDEFKELSGEDIVEGIKWAMIGDCEDAVLGLVRCLRDPMTYFAEHLQGSMEGLGTDDSKLISIIVLRSEIDLQNIKDRYKELYDKDLADAIRSECSGDYKKMLLALLGGGQAKGPSNSKDPAAGTEGSQLPAPVSDIKPGGKKGIKTEKGKSGESGRHTIVSKSDYRQSSKTKGKDTAKSNERKKTETSTMVIHKSEEKKESVKHEEKKPLVKAEEKRQAVKGSGNESRVKNQKKASKPSKKAIKQDKVGANAEKNVFITTNALESDGKSEKVPVKLDSTDEKDKNMHNSSPKEAKKHESCKLEEGLANDQRATENEKMTHNAEDNIKEAVLQGHLLKTILGEDIQGNEIQKEDRKDDQAVLNEKTNPPLNKDNLLDAILKETPEDENRSIVDKASNSPNIKDDLLDEILKEENPEEEVKTTVGKTCNEQIAKEDLLDAILKEGIPDEGNATEPSKTSKGSSVQDDLLGAILQEETPEKQNDKVPDNGPKVQNELVDAILEQEPQEESNDPEPNKTSKGTIVQDDLLEAILQEEAPKEENGTEPNRTSYGFIVQDDLLDAILQEETPEEKNGTEPSKPSNGPKVQNDLLDAILQEETPEEKNDKEPNKASKCSIIQDDLLGAILQEETPEDKNDIGPSKPSNGPKVKDDLLDAILQEETPEGENGTEPNKTSNGSLIQDDLLDAILQEETSEEKNEEPNKASKGSMVQDDLLGAILLEKTPEEENGTEPNKTSNNSKVQDDLFDAILHEETPEEKNDEEPNKASKGSMVQDDLLGAILLEKTPEEENGTEPNKTSNNSKVQDDLFDAILHEETPEEKNDEEPNKASKGSMVQDDLLGAILLEKTPEEENGTEPNKTSNGSKVQDDLLNAILQEETSGGKNDKEPSKASKGSMVQDDLLGAILLEKTPEEENGTEPNKTSNGSKVQDDLLNAILQEETSGEKNDKEPSKASKGSIVQDDLLDAILQEETPEEKSDTGPSNAPKVQDDLLGAILHVETPEEKNDKKPNKSLNGSIIQDDLLDAILTEENPQDKTEFVEKKDKCSDPNEALGQNGNAPECKADTSTIKDGHLGLVLEKDAVDVIKEITEKEPENDINVHESTSGEVASGHADNSPIKDDLLEMILKEPPLSTTTKDKGEPHDGNDDHDSGQTKHATDNSDLTDNLLGLILAEDNPDKVDDKSENLEKVSSENGKEHDAGQSNLQDEHLKKPLEESSPNPKSLNSEDDHTKKEESMPETLPNSNVEADLLGAILGGPTYTDTPTGDNKQGSVPECLKEQVPDEPNSTRTAEDEPAAMTVGDDLLGSILSGGTEDYTKHENHSSDGKDEGIDMDTESKEDSSSDKQNDDKQQLEKENNTSESAEKGPPLNAESSPNTCTTVTNEKRPTRNEVTLQAEVHADSTGVKGTPEADKLRPRDPMLSVKQEEMERKSRTERIDTLDDINPELLKKLNLELYRQTQPSFLENEAESENPDLPKDGPAEGPAESRDTEDADDQAIAVGGREYASTDEEVADDELYADDWDPELEAVVGKGMGNSPQNVIKSKSPYPPTETEGAAVKQLQLDSNSLKVDEVSMGGDSGIGYSTEDIEKANGKPSTAKDQRVNENAVKGLVSTIIENSLNEFTANNQVRENVGDK